MTFGWYFRTLIQSELVTEGSALMMALDINTIFYEYNYLYRMSQKIQKEYEIHIAMVLGHRVSSITAARSSLQ